MSIGNERFVVHICYGGVFENVNNVPTYLPIDCFRTPLKLPVYTEKPMNRKILLKNVLKKLCLPLNSSVCMKYKFGMYIFDITDDAENFQDFLEYAINHAPIEIYVVEKTRSASGSGSNQPRYQPQETHESKQIETENADVSLCHTQTRKPFPETETKLSHGTEFDMAHHDEENVFKDKLFECPFNDSDEDSEKEDAEGETNIEESDIFWNMPPLLGENEPEIMRSPVCTYERSHLIEEGMTFENKAEFIRQLGTKCLQENFQIKPIKSDKSRYVARCILPECEWKCNAYKLQGSDNFLVRRLNDVHTCSRTQIMGNNKHANKKVLGHLLMNSMKLENRVYRAREIQADINARFRVSISYNQAWRAKCYAIELLRGSMDDSFRILPLYFHNLKLHNPGSVTNILTDSDDRFQMCYMSIGAAVSNLMFV